MQLKHLGKLLSGVGYFVSQDTTRQMLCHAFVPNETTVEAADGHKLIRVTVPKGHGLAAGYYDVNRSLALCKAEVIPSPVIPAESWQWPQLDLVIPPRVEAGEGVPGMLLDMRYVVETVTGMRHALAPFGHDNGVRVQFPGDVRSAVRFDAVAEGGMASAVAVLMPRYQ